MQEEFDRNDIYCTLPSIQSLQAWNLYDQLLCEAVVVCPVCGHGNICTYCPREKKHDFDAEFEDREVQSSCLHAYMSYSHLHHVMYVTKLDEEVSSALICKQCSNDAMFVTRSEATPVVSDTYLSNMLKCEDWFLARMSVVNVSLDIMKKQNGTPFGVNMMESSLFTAPMFHNARTMQDTTRHGNKYAVTNTMKTFAEYNYSTNPLDAKYVPYIERQLDFLGGYPIVSASCIANIPSKSQKKDPHATVYTTKTDDDETPECASDAMMHTLTADMLMECLTQNLGDKRIADTHMHHTSNKKLCRGEELFVLGEAYTRDNDALIRIYSQSDGCTVHSDTFNSHGESPENCIMPFLFPTGTEQYRGKCSLLYYAKMRAKGFLTLYTLHPSYMLMMYLMVRTHTLRAGTTQLCLRKEVSKYVKAHPDASDNDVYNNIVKHKLTPQLTSSPAWHKKELQDLIAAVEVHGLPSLFLTLTSDEVSRTRWPAFTNLEDLLGKLKDGMTWKDAPVESAKIFVHKLNKFMHTWIIPPAERKKGRTHTHKYKEGILGLVEHFVIRYEVQGRGSLHAHIMLWIHEDDIDRVCSEITAHKPGTTRADGLNEAPHSSDVYARKIHDQVIQKQVHDCGRELCKGCNGRCKLGFPYKIQSSKEPQFNKTTLRYEYYRPRKTDRNVVPYHPLVLLLWGAHMNIQKVTNCTWTFYLLKYVNKMEPHGNMTLDEASAKALGIKDMTLEQLKCAAGMFISKPVSVTEASMHLLGQSILTKSSTLSCTYISTPTPDKRACIFAHPAAARTNSKVTTHAIDQYVARPTQLEAVTFYDYHRKYLRREAKYKKAMPHTYIGTDTLGQHVYKYENPRVVRFTNYSPASNPQGFFFNELLRCKAFRDEADLPISHCYFKGFLHHVARDTNSDMLVLDLIQHHVEAHCKRHLYTNPDTAKLVDMCCERLQLEHSVLNVTCCNITSEHLHGYIGLTTCTSAFMLTTCKQIVVHTT